MKTIVVNGRKGQAVFSADLRYRYALSRPLDPRAVRPNLCQFIMLNPSTADADVDDPTVTRCLNYARCWAHTGVVITNLFAMRATDPGEIYRADDPVGAGNARFVLQVATHPDVTRVVCAWGVHGGHTGAGDSMLRVLRCHGVAPCALRITMHGQPAHPLYLPRHLEPLQLPASSLGSFPARQRIKSARVNPPAASAGSRSRSAGR